MINVSSLENINPGEVLKQVKQTRICKCLELVDVCYSLSLEKREAFLKSKLEK